MVFKKRPFFPGGISHKCVCGISPWKRNVTSISNPVNRPTWSFIEVCFLEIFYFSYTLFSNGDGETKYVFQGLLASPGLTSFTVHTDGMWVTRSTSSQSPSSQVRFRESTPPVTYGPPSSCYFFPALGLPDPVWKENICVLPPMGLRRTVSDVLSVPMVWSDWVEVAWRFLKILAICSWATVSVSITPVSRKDSMRRSVFVICKCSLWN